MKRWGWFSKGPQSDVAATIVAVAERRGLERSATAKGTSASVRITQDGIDGVLVTGAGIAGLDVARELSRTLGVSGRYAEVDLDVRDVSAVARDISDDGTPGDAEDLDELVSETCAEWFDDRNYRPESIDDLIALCVGIDDVTPTSGVEITFKRASSARVVALLEAVRTGARWERTVVAGRSAVRVVDGKGTRISVLDDDELTAFEAAAAKG